MATEQNDQVESTGETQEQPAGPEQPGFQTPEEARSFLQQEAQNRAQIAQQKVEEVLSTYRVRMEPHVTITPRGQYAQLHFIPE